MTKFRAMQLRHAFAFALADDLVAVLFLLIMFYIGVSALF